MFVYFMTGTPEGPTESGFMEKLGIEPATPGLQDIGFSPYTTAASLLNYHKLVVAFLGSNQFRQVVLRFVCWITTGTPKGSAKVVLWRRRESNPGCDPWITRHRFIPIHHGGFSTKLPQTFCGFPG